MRRRSRRPTTITPEVPREPAPITDVADFGVPGGVDATGAVFAPGSRRAASLLPPPPPPPPAAAQAPVRVGGVIRAPQKIRDVAPRYPVIAQQSRVQGS